MIGRPTHALLFLLLIPLLVAACGVPISAEEIAATAESGGGQASVQTGQQTQLTAVMQASGVSADQPAEVSSRATTALLAPTVGGTIAPASTRATGTVVPEATGTPATPFPTPATSVTATATPSSARTLAFGADGTPVGTTTVTVTPDATATPQPPAAATAVASTGGTSAGGDVNELLRLLNEARAGIGLSPLRPNSTLAGVAGSYARTMAISNFFSHNGLDGSTPEGRVDASGYSGDWRGETLAAGQATAELAFDVWWNKRPPHRAILVDPGATEVGIGYYFDPSGTYGYYWVLEIGTP